MRTEQSLERDCEWRRRRRRTWHQRRYACPTLFPRFALCVRSGCRIDVLTRWYRSVRSEQLGRGDVYAGCAGDLVSSLYNAPGTGLSERCLSYRRTICQRNIQEERRRVQTIVEQLPQRTIAKPSEDSEAQR